MIFGYPVTCRGGQYQVVKGIEVSEFSRKRIDATLKELHEERDSVKTASRMSAGDKFRKALKEEKPLQIVGTINAYHALMAKRVGYRAIYLSGGGVAAGSLGMPDLGISNLDDVLTDIRRITDVCDLPLLVDVDTGFGASAFNVARTTRSLIKVGAAAPCTSRTRSAPSAAATVPARSWSPRTRWPTASRRRSMRAPIPAS